MRNVWGQLSLQADNEMMLQSASQNSKLPGILRKLRDRLIYGELPQQKPGI